VRRRILREGSGRGARTPRHLATIFMSSHPVTPIRLPSQVTLIKGGCDVALTKLSAGTSLQVMTTKSAA
jgi:hypothetical protein